MNGCTVCPSSPLVQRHPLPWLRVPAPGLSLALLGIHVQPQPRRVACCRPPRHRNNQSPHNPYPCKRLREWPQTAQRWPHISASAVFCACGEYQHHQGTPPGAERSPYGRLSAALADTQHAAASAVRSATFLPALLPSPRTPLHAEVPPGGHGGSACAGAVTGSRSGTGTPALKASPAAAVPSVAAAVARTSGAIARGPQQPGGVVGGAASMTQRDGDAGRASSTAQPCQVWEALAMAEFCVFHPLRSLLGWCELTSISCSPSLVGRCKGPHAHRQTGGKGSLPPHPGCDSVSAPSQPTFSSSQRGNLYFRDDLPLLGATVEERSLSFEPAWKIQQSCHRLVALVWQSNAFAVAA